MKKIVTLLSIAILATAMLCGCSSTSQSSNQNQTQQEEPQVELLNLDGTWESTKDILGFGTQKAVISGDTIEIYWIQDDGDTESLYWAGTVTVPADMTVEEDYTWESVNDKSKTDKALLASGEDSKEFTYSDGEITYKTSAMGQTTTVHLIKAE